MKYVTYLNALNDFHEIPITLRSCHVAMVEGYIVEGHVPVEALWKLLAEKPDIKGLSLPGMPAGSPGMGGVKNGRFNIYAMTDGGNSLFMVY